MLPLTINQYFLDLLKTEMKISIFMSYMADRPLYYSFVHIQNSLKSPHVDGGK